MARVIYIAGNGRSGTTVLSQILGSYDGCIAVGELYDLWTEYEAGNRLCSCGAPIRECPFWNDVLTATLGQLDRASVQHVIELRSSVQAMHHLPLLLFPRIRPKTFDKRVGEYVDVLTRLYGAIQTVSGCDVIIDSSKLAAYALMLNESPAIDVDLIHVVRDSRACVYSWSRSKPEYFAGDQPRFLLKRPLVQTASVWTVRNLVLDAVTPTFTRSIKLKYEDFARRPYAVTERLARRLGLAGQERIWASQNEVDVSRSNHIFAGNPVRVQSGRVAIRADEEWKTKMPVWQQRFVYALTLPAQIGRDHGRFLDALPEPDPQLLAGKGVG